MQYVGKDNILNFGLSQNISTLSVGNGMQAKSLIIVLVALLIQDRRLPEFRILKRIIYFGTLCFCVYYFFAHNVWSNFVYARGPVWLEGIKIGLQHPVMGWGLGEWKVVFPQIAVGEFNQEGAWYSVHNFPIQVFFEMGVVGLATLLFYTRSVWRKCLDSENLFVGLLLLIYTLSVHFPAFQTTSCCLVVLFFAYIERKQK